ncbi:hypothetical protein GCM10020218_027660 [Dactylosporangium vinaceum]
MTPSYMLTIIDEFEKQALDPRESSLEIGIFGAAALDRADGPGDRERRGMHAVDIYGLSEVIGARVAQECVETRTGCHIWEDHFYPEVVDPDSGAVLPEGELGELGITRHSPRGDAHHPVLAPATCTRLLGGHGAGAVDAMRRMEKVNRPLRRHDHPARGEPVPDADTRRSSCATAGLAPHFQLVLTTRGRMDDLDRDPGRARSGLPRRGAGERAGPRSPHRSRTPSAPASTSRWWSRRHSPAPSGKLQRLTRPTVRHVTGRGRPRGRRSICHDVELCGEL